LTAETVPSRSADYPRSWLWDEDGNLVSGSFVRFDEGVTKDFGSKVIVVLDVGGEERAVWLTTMVLHGRFSDELERRATKRLEVGERVVIERGADRVESENGRSYWPFKILFPNRPQKSEAELFGLDEGLARTDELTLGKAAGDDAIPF